MASTQLTKLTISKDGKFICKKKLQGGSFEELKPLLEAMKKAGLIKTEIQIETPSGNIEIFIPRKLTAEELKLFLVRHPDFSKWRDLLAKKDGASDCPSPLVHLWNCTYVRV